MSERPRIAIAFLTGQSTPGRTALSPAQAAFLAALPLPGVEMLRVNFPYQPDPAPHVEAPLLRASLANARQYLHSRTAEFRARHREEVESAFAPFEQIILLAGSCGLELLRNLDLAPVFRLRCHVFAYGPVARGRVECARLCLVQGRADFFSRAWFPRVEHRLPGGHLGYLAQPTMRSLFLDFCQPVLHSSLPCPR